MTPSNTEEHNVEVPGSLRRERPWLYPYNRRLRHLHGISIRNLSINAPQTRPRSASVDDEALPYAKKSPAKTLAIRNQKQLEHSRSQTNLRSIQESASTSSLNAKGKENAIDDGGFITPPRPRLQTMRRRSTLEWVNASPQVRQKKLEDILVTRMVNVFFSLHISGLAEPIYISEALEKVMNPDFRFFNLSEIGPSISRLEDLSVKVWARSDEMDDYKFLIEMNVALRSLQFLGKTMASWQQPLPPNCILFHMKDGIYTSFTDMPAIEPPITSLSTPQRALSNQVLPTSSYDALMRLSTLDDCIQDALQTRAKLEQEINGILEANKEPMDAVRLVSVKQQRVKDIEDAITTEKKQLASARKRRDELRAQLAQRKHLMQEGYESMSSGSTEVATLAETVGAIKEVLSQTAEEITGQRRRVCEDLLKIYPIEPLPNRSLAFTMRGLPLPNAEFEDVDEEVTAAALGHVAQVVYLLQYYLSIPLLYPIQTRGSTSLIEDPISDTSGSRTYPLFIRGAIKYRFEFGVFLLNKNIEILSNHIGLRFMDPRQTLPNLKYLLYIATAGKGEIPARKAGGIRGFLRGEGSGSAISSRRGSQDSEASELFTDGKQSLGVKQGLAVKSPPGKGMFANSPTGMGRGKANGIVKTGYGGLGKQTVRAGSKLRDVS